MEAKNESNWRPSGRKGPIWPIDDAHIVEDCDDVQCDDCAVIDPHMTEEGSAGVSSCRRCAGSRYVAGSLDSPYQMDPCMECNQSVNVPRSMPEGASVPDVDQAAPEELLQGFTPDRQPDMFGEAAR